MALFCSLTNLSTSVLKRAPQRCPWYSRIGVTSALYRGEMPSLLPCLYSHGSHQPLPCSIMLGAEDELLVHCSLSSSLTMWWGRGSDTWASPEKGRNEIVPCQCLRWGSDNDQQHRCKSDSANGSAQGTDETTPWSRCILRFLSFISH